MTLLEHIFSAALLRALGFTLLHSLWQGAAIGLAVALLLVALHRQAAVVRYRLAAVGLASLIGLAGFTFCYYYMAGAPAIGDAALVLPANTQAILEKAAPVASSSPFSTEHMWLSASLSYTERHLPVLVGIWLLGFSLMTARLGVALLYVRRLRRQVGAVPAVWQQCLDNLVTRAGFGRPIRLLASAAGSTPLVIGYFKPVILLPLAVISRLAPAELEMILAHELAHILRKDYLFNFVQSIAETLFFYHPAVWFLSATLRAEREKCCDDLATELCGSPQQLARALAALAELNYAPTAAIPQLALAALAPDDSLVSRVRRLAFYRHAKATGFWPASLVLLGFGLLLGSLLLRSNTSHALSPYATQEKLKRQGFTTTRTRLASTTRNSPDGMHTPITDDQLQGIFQARLQADGLLPNPDKYHLSLTAEQLLINGRPQPAAVAAQYRQLYATATGITVAGTTSYKTENVIITTVAQVQPKALSVHAPPAPDRAALRAQLQQDGLVASTATSFQVEATTTGQLTVNGRVLPPSLLSAYRPLLRLPAPVAGRTTTVKVTVH